jgi:hypothetical protein
MKSRFPFAVVGPLVAVAGAVLLIPLFLSKDALAAPATQFDFGDATTQPGYVTVGATTTFSPALGYGWLETPDLALRDRKKPDDLRRDFVMGKGANTFRITGLKAGRYLLKITAGDTDYGDHVLRVRVAGSGDLPLVSPKIREFQTLSATVDTQGTLDITFDSPQDNWVVNALSLELAPAAMKPSIASQIIASEPVPSTWDAEIFKTDPTKPLLDAFRLAAQKNAPRDFRSTGLKRGDYLKLIASEVDFWKTQQNADGAIIDPYSKQEIQYSTPAFANAAAVLVAHGGRTDLMEPASKALDWATMRLAERKAANSHEDFYPTMIAHALMLLKPQVKPERAAQWENNIRRFDPYKTYRMAMGSMNWNIVSSAGESLFQKMGLRDKTSQYVADSFAAQGHHFTSPYGLYLEGPMAYDHFPRIFLADVLAQGYSGPYQAELSEALRRAAITSLFMQSPWGELPAGGRSANHQWNEAEQCVTYEIYAAKAKKEGDDQLAGVYKRAAHLALASMQRWVRPSGEMQIIKNWVDPAQRHAYEGYSAHSQYNLLPMAMLANAYEYAGETETSAESPAPADVGGFILDLPEMHKVFANAAGTYVELDTQADSHYDATGLIRVQMKGISPQLGPSDSLMAHASYNSPNPVPMTTGVGAAWKGADGAWHTLGEMDGTRVKTAKLTQIAKSPERIAFDVSYEGELSGPSRVIEHYVLTPGRVELSTEVQGYTGALRYMWPVLADDGKTKTSIVVRGQTVSVSLDGGKNAQTFTAPGAQSVAVGEPLYSNHNGWARVASAEYPAGGKITLVIAPSQNP